MALYKEPKYLAPSDDGVFDSVHKPGTTPPRSGIYRCVVCGKEVVGEEARALPPQNHHQHSAGAGPISWQLAVYADHRGK